MAMNQFDDWDDIVTPTPLKPLVKALNKIKGKHDIDCIDSMCGYEEDSYDSFDKEYMGEEW